MKLKPKTKYQDFVDFELKYVVELLIVLSILYMFGVIS
jgi:hypothetical protein